jgi:hypothetical protein
MKSAALIGTANCLLEPKALRRTAALVEHEIGLRNNGEQDAMIKSNDQMTILSDSDDKVRYVVKRSMTPFCDAARVLLAEHVQPPVLSQSVSARFRHNSLTWPFSKRGRTN